MISFTLSCDNEHTFEAWFSNSEAFEKQRKKKIVACPHCGSTKVQKSLMAPNVGVRENRKSQAPAATAPPQAGELVEAMRKLRSYVEDNADYVGDKFAEEARKIHYEETDPRGIYGETSLDDAKELVEEGIEIYPMPALPEEKN